MMMLRHLRNFPMCNSANELMKRGVVLDKLFFLSRISDNLLRLELACM